MESKAKFMIGDLLPLALTVVVAGIGIAYGLNVVADVRDDMVVNSVEYNATQDTIDAVAKFPAKLGLIVTVLIAAVLLSILVRYLLVRNE